MNPTTYRELTDRELSSNLRDWATRINHPVGSFYFEISRKLSTRQINILPTRSKPRPTGVYFPEATLFTSVWGAQQR